MSDYETYKFQLESILVELEKNIRESTTIQAKFEYQTQYALKIKLTTGGDFDADILPAPAVNNVEHAGRPIFH